MKKTTIKEQNKVMDLIGSHVMVEKKIHSGFRNVRDSKDSIFRKYRYIYSSPKGKITLIQFGDWVHHGLNWGIHCLEGDLFGDVRRFVSKEEAEKEIYRLLE